MDYCLPDCKYSIRHRKQVVYKVINMMSKDLLPSIQPKSNYHKVKYSLFRLSPTNRRKSVNENPLHLGKICSYRLIPVKPNERFSNVLQNKSNPKVGCTRGFKLTKKQPTKRTLRKEEPSIALDGWSNFKEPIDLLSY